jgi:hypothetical protein
MRRAGFVAVGGGHQPEPSRRPGHGVLAAELAVHAAADRGSPVPGRGEGGENQRRGDGRAAGSRQDRDENGRGVKEMTDRMAEHEQGDDQEGREPARGPGITDHGQPRLAAFFPLRVGRAPLPSYTWIAQLSRKVKTLCRLAVNAA